jgi:N-acetylmuramoyl-L-alanine amidase
MGLGRAVAALAVWLLMVAGAAAQDAGLSALARPVAAASRVYDAGPGVQAEIALSQPVPWRVRLLDGPPRLVIDFREVDWSGLDIATLLRGRRVAEARAGRVAAGWSRLVLELDGPYRVASAEMRTDPAGGMALVRVRLDPEDPAEFLLRASEPEPPGWTLPRPSVAAPAPRRQDGVRPLTVVLDPGHGGIDPGAERDGLTEAALMLGFARELREALDRAGGFEVVLTRDDDVFVPLGTRIDIAQAVGADVFLSLHADALSEGEATGATLYTLSEEASDEASAALAARHDRASLLAGVDLSGQDDVVAGVLLDLARQQSAPRSSRLADALVEAIGTAGIRLHRVPRRAAAFSVLRSPDIPSALVELGYLSSARDKARLTDPEWRARVAAAIVAGLRTWAVADAAEAGQLRR